MTARDCITGKAGAGKVDQARADEAAGLFDEIRADLEGSMSGADADVRAGIMAADAMARRVARETANRLRMAKTGDQLRHHIETFTDGKGRPQPGRAALNVLTRDLGDRSTLPTVEGRSRTVLGLAHAIADDFLERTRPRKAGLDRGKARVESIVRGLFGEEVDEVSRAAADAWSSAAEYLRKRFNAAGGTIARRADWGMPQSHDPRLVAKADYDTWAGFIRPLLARDRMLDFETGAPMSDLRFETLLRATYERIKTDGMVDLEPGFVPRGGKSLANSRAESRFLAFRDADGWLTYQRRFGNPDHHGALVNHLRDMSMDIARMEVLGPNPKAMLDFMEQVVDRKVGMEGLNATVAGAAKRELRAVDDDLSGRALIPLRPGWASGFAALRNVLTSAQLGSAALSSVSDVMFQNMARAFNGLPGVERGLVPLLRQLTPATIADQKLAVRMGLVAENWSSAALAQSRYFGEVIGPRWSEMFADVVLRATGLSPWTQAGRWSFGMEFLGHLADHAGEGLGAMPAPTRRAMARYGIDEAAWRRVTAEALTQERGATLLDMRKLHELDPELGARVHDMVLSETEFAVPTVNARVRSQLRLTRDAPPGSLMGEVVRSVSMYKSFPVSIVHSHVMRTMRTAMPRGQRVRYVAQLTIGLTLFGALALQAKQVARGRDPQDMTTWEFWAASAAQGGGLGIFGDFLFSDANRVGGGLTETAAGPVVKFLTDADRLVRGNLQEAVAGEDTNAGRDAVRFAELYTPGTSVWYARLALERMVWDELALAVDPHAERRFRREERTALRERGQEYFWRPGRTTPDRAPDFNAALGE